MNSLQHIFSLDVVTLAHQGLIEHALSQELLDNPKSKDLVTGRALKRIYLEQQLYHVAQVATVMIRYFLIRPT